jgi:hypothetical protein
MRSLCVSLAVIGFVAPSLTPCAAQHGGGPPPVTTAPREASQYDFLIGQWELAVKPEATTLAAKIHGMPKLTGTWKAWRALDGWGVEDALRIVDASGNPLAMTQFVRVYNAAAHQWALTAVEAYHGRITTSTARWTGAGMESTARITDEDGKPFLSRTRVYKITPTSFRYQQDRSNDDGKTWSEGVLTIDAKRTAATAPRH